MNNLFCSNCGKSVAGKKFCSGCGVPVAADGAPISATRIFEKRTSDRPHLARKAVDEMKISLRASPSGQAEVSVVKWKYDGHKFHSDVATPASESR